LNTRKKLKEMGFKKQGKFLKSFTPDYEEYELVDEDLKRVWTYGGFEWVESPMNRPKYETFWKMEMGSLEIYIHLSKDDIRKIMLYDRENKKIETKEANGKDLFIFKSKKDILKYFPKSVNRSMTIENLLKGN